jgi:hypothetical protein
VSTEAGDVRITASQHENRIRAPDKATIAASRSSAMLLPSTWRELRMRVGEVAVEDLA